MKEVFNELCKLCKKYDVEISFNKDGFILRKFENDTMFNKMHSIESYKYLHDSLSLEDIIVDFVQEWEAHHEDGSNL